MRSGGALLLGAVAAICLCAPASSATIKTMPGKDRSVAIQISGQLQLGDADIFIDMVKQATVAGKIIENVRLNSAGGKLVEGAKLAAVIKAGKIATFVSREPFAHPPAFWHSPRAIRSSPALAH
jgi:hypothetical protein